MWTNQCERAKLWFEPAMAVVVTVVGGFGSGGDVTLLLLMSSDGEDVVSRW